MRLIIDLLYHGTRIDSRQVDVYHRTHQHRPIELDIGRIIDERTKHAVEKALSLLEPRKAH